jgi:predicted nucleic acid-binding protein
VNRGYLDTSILVAIALGEEGADRLRARLGRFETLFASGLLEAELLSALSRENVDVRDVDAYLRPLSLVEPSRRLTPEIVRILSAGRLRGADLWHLACALYVSPDPRELAFLTLDREQGSVARKLGFRISGRR